MQSDRPRDFTMPAIITFLLYFAFWVPGLIANLAYRSAALAEQRRTGLPPRGLGLLKAWLWVFVYVPLILFGIGVVIIIVVSILYIWNP